jgi:hypothetical protein
MIGALIGLPGKIKTLLDRLTATRAGLLDNLDAAMTTRAAASTALSTATWSATKAGYLDVAISSRLSAAVKSIQTGYRGGALASSGTGEDLYYADITLGTAVTVAKTFVILQHAATTNNSGTGRVTSTTNLRLSRSDSNGMTCRYYVVEFY